MKNNEGYVLLKSLLTMAVILVCTAVLFYVFAVSAKHSRNTGTRLEEELSYRKTIIMDQLK